MKSYLLLSSALAAVCAALSPLFAVGGHSTQPPQPAPLLTEKDPALAEYLKKAYASAPLPPLINAPAHLPPLAKGTPGRFRVIALPANFEANGLNNKGEIAGTWNEEKAAVWSKGKVRIFPTVYTEANGPNNPPLGTGTVMSDASVIGGSSGKVESGAYIFEARSAALWDTSGKKRAGRSIGHLPELSCAFVSAVNARGQVVGLSVPYSPFEQFKDPTSDLSGPPEQSNGFFWDGQQMRNLGRGGAYGINARGQVIGTQNEKIVLWQGSEKRILGDGGGLAINNRGQILAVSSGFIQDSSMEPQSVPLTRAVLLYRGKSIALGLLAGDKDGKARSLNDRGEVVGFSYRTVVGTDRAFLWRSGRMYDLNRFVSARSGWILSDARSINNKGWIVGTGTLRGENRSFLLVPK